MVAKMVVAAVSTRTVVTVLTVFDPDVVADRNCKGLDPAEHRV
jgi:hypothetical protein